MWVLEETVCELKRILAGHSVVSGEPNCMFIHARFAYKILVEK